MGNKDIFSEEIQPDAGDLLIFVDDTGHETFAGNQGFYGLGGCAVLAIHYELLKQSWRSVRQKINGNPDLPLHGSEFPRVPENFAALAEFFRDGSFLRFAATVTKAVAMPGGLPPCVPVMAELKGQVADLAGKLPCKRAFLIFESSERADPIVQATHDQLVLEVEAVKPVEKCIMPKSSNEPGLEIADFIVGAAGSQARRTLAGRTGFAPDFTDVFRQLDVAGCRYREVLEVVPEADGRIRTSGKQLTA